MTTAKIKAEVRPVFTAAGGEFTFDTDILRGKLRTGGKSLGLTSVIHVPSGKRLDRSNGLLSHYRVFTSQKRYGGGAWDWPSQGKLLADGSVEVSWSPDEVRPFDMKAIYRWISPSILEVETIVAAKKDFSGFESFLASYFSESFTNAAALVSKSPENNGQPGFLPARSSYGPWLMFPRDNGVLSLIKDGRWELQPNPVNWTIMPAFEKPIAWRRDASTGLTVVLLSPKSDCFTLAMPHQAEGHYSCYLSLFGRDFKVGQIGRARARMVIANSPSEQEILQMYRQLEGN